MLNQIDGPRADQRQTVRNLVQLGPGGAIVEICSVLEIDGMWLEQLALKEVLLAEAA